MEIFPSVHSYSRFAHAVRRRWRFSRDPEQVDFLAKLLATSETRRTLLPAGSLVFRAQLGCDWPSSDEEETRDPGPRPFQPERMKPLRDRAAEGRVNPRGIPCLYTATRAETAAAEVRPWMGAYVSVAQMKILRDLVLVNCTSDDRRTMIYLSEPSPTEREIAVWRDIDRAFAQPVDRDEYSADYAPTQVIAELFREHGLDGIAYRSSLGEGHNIALFDLDAAAVINFTVHEVRGIRFDVPEAGNRCYVSEHYPELGALSGSERTDVGES
jgi:RES domain-containing protein